ncbi:CMP-N-acetylneuraminic acid synthetase [Sulfurospirillum barnesii SES-3]|uniref:CMP-N-acetylneuraminic acid synthetase n=2 Tax=Sulfurospirillum barnesii TaxID=44674 RepID=I3XZ00_SULBS|nr:CMP-N-acetylneuraminic acid synthetase [Sulfurospirillum barnesii SES-3]
MYKNKKILALITARGGSKGIPNKNIKSLGGKPLIAWTIDEAKKSSYIDRLILSSDSEEIMQIAKSYGCSVPFVRPRELASDTSSSIDAILHAINTINEDFDYLMLLQPTSPFRRVDDIDKVIEQAIDKGIELMISVVKFKKHPSYLYKIENNVLVPYIDTNKQLRRQDMPETYEHNGAIYFSTVTYMRENKTYNHLKAVPFEMFGMANLDIDTQEDWDYAEYLIQKGLFL